MTMDSDGHVFFHNVNNPPPGGLYFYETHGERVVARTFIEIEPKVRALMEKYGIKGLPEVEVAKYMCPRIPNPGAYCRGSNVTAAHIRPHAAIVNSLPYCKRQPVAFDIIERRLQICHDCPQHARDWCPTCSGHVSRILHEFNGKRTSLPQDKLSGVCQCAKAYEMAIASVEYGDDEKIWEGAPDTCWRKKDV